MTILANYCYGETTSLKDQQKEGVYRLLNEGRKKELTELAVLRIEVASSTEADVEESIGPPQKTSNYDHYKESVYIKEKIYHGSTLLRNLALAPLIGLAPEIGELFSSPIYRERKFLIINFDKNGIAQRYLYNDFGSVLISSLESDGSILRCYSNNPPTFDSKGWRKCTEIDLQTVQHSLGN